LRATNVAEAREAIRQARAINGPVLIEFVVEKETNVFPMIQPGKSLNEMTRRPIQPAALGGGFDFMKEKA
jgi:acetolactate synthase-1/2/3 large subunit